MCTVKTSSVSSASVNRTIRISGLPFLGSQSLAPIAIQTAHALEVNPLPFLFTVIFAANCSFATPMGYQTNLLVMGPGHYRFADFLRGGVPLIILLWVCFSAFAPWYYDL